MAHLLKRPRVLVSALAACALCACSSTSSNPIPSPISGDADKDPISCSGLSDAQITNKEIRLDGGVAACGADGLRCPFSGALATTTACGTKRAIAICVQQRWTLACEEPGDGGTSADAGPSSDSGDGAASADAEAGAGSLDATDAATDTGVD